MKRDSQEGVAAQVTARREPWPCRDTFDLARPANHPSPKSPWKVPSTGYYGSHARKTSESSVPQPGGLGHRVLFSMRKPRVSLQIHTQQSKHNLELKLEQEQALNGSSCFEVSALSLSSLT